MPKLTDMDDIDICERTPALASAEPSIRRSYPSADDELVGFDDAAKNVIQKLIGGPTELDIISIVGMGGIGKTTLARMLYNNHSNHFDVQVWCTISRTYNVRKLLLEMLKQIMGDTHVTINDYSIVDVLRKILRTKKYLIVLDDIWEVKVWEELRLSFPDGGNGSRIMLTTRDTEVAMELKHHSDPYFLSRLNDKQSWELLQKKVFQGESCPPELQSVGAEIATLTKGLPLAVTVIAGILSQMERQASLWLEVAHKLCSSSLEQQLSMRVIQLSYDRLADHLKPCLLYMGLFPKRYEIPVSDLLKWWIAEEFVQNIDTLKLEEISRSCLYDLVSRSLVMVSKRRTNGEIKNCIVHDLVREFCMEKITKEKFMQPLVPYNPRQTSDTDEQRLCMYIHGTMNSNMEIMKSFGQRQKMLEFIAHPKFSISESKSLFPLLNNLRLIRVLHLLDIYLQDSWAAAFQSLTHLRFLAIFVKAFNFKWVSHLLHLQTLRVRSSYIMISPSIWQMEKLRHVDINEFSITWEESSEFVLHNLKTLGMCYMSVSDMTPKFWGKFPNLEELSLHIDEFGNVPQHSLFPMPVSIGKSDRNFVFPSSLKVLSLSDIFLTDEIVSGIAELPHLETLKLSEIYFTGEKQWDLSDHEFKTLKVLKLHHVFMTKWIFSEELFPLLEKLVIKSCSKLEEIPLSLAYCPALQLIKVIDCRDSVGNSAVDIQRDVGECTGCDRLQVHILKTKNTST